MTNPAVLLALHDARAADLRAEADAHRLAGRAGRPVELRARLGWALVEMGLRLAVPPKRVLAG
ncbi:hypothetical protein [Streptomyces chromofuscus]|uniref:Uncharacterized protein n=1 Tax=Streptomyces chromofuscus TaxID=42881 RepID=A0A7M2TFK2_STRCW|nr:hypothetical protein [Streptomyces chromofuscus]QOV46929.1 hypothetical protein IPT68_14225 [Streptomyces chromofuscus]GGT14593.1 hypothetical protein GCM10010254_39140 [Streptomyces chromofuscus]